MKTQYFILIICCCIFQQFVSAQTLYTPKGSVFMGFQRDELTPEERNSILIEVRKYPQATILASETNTYNCHSYAWNMTCGGPTCWVNAGPTPATNSNISVNWIDGSYVETTANYAEKIYYYQGDHSAVVSTTVSGMYESKWGAWPLMRHAPGYGPENYVMDKRRYYKRNIPGTPFSGSSLLNKDGMTTISLVSALGTPHYYSWSCSPNLEIVSSTATSVTVLPKYRKAGWIKMNNHNRELEFKTWYGTPELNISGEFRVPNGQYARFEAIYDRSSNPTAFEWILNPVNGNTIYGANTAFLDVGFYNAGDYQIVVRATNAHGVGEYCVRGLTVYNTIGYTTTKVYPNPAKDVLNIFLNLSNMQSSLAGNKSVYQIRLFSGQGNLVRQASMSGEEIQLNVSNLPNGYYYLHIYTDNGNNPEIHKIIIDH